MNRNLALVVIFVVFSGMLTLAFEAQPVKAEPEIWTVDDDGPADFHTVQEAVNAANTGDTIYVYNGTYYENVVVNKTVSLIGENREATIIDGNGSGDAVTLLSNGTSLSSFTLHASGLMAVALRLENVSSTTIANNTLTNSFSGILLTFSNFNTIRDNKIAPGSYYSIFQNSSYNTLTRNSIGALRFRGSFNNTLTENAIELFWLEFSPNTKLRDNNFTHFAVGGDVDTHFVHDIDTSNLVNEKPVYYWINRENAEVPSDAGYVALINCLNITVRDLSFENGSQSIVMFSTNNSRILNNNITNIAEGIWISSSSNNIIYGNNITATHLYGIYLYRSSNSTVHGNNITANGVGIWLARSSNNSIFHNSFINNSVQVNSYKSTSIWDVGYPSGGNYWSNYNGTDADHDGIGDTPYIIDANNVDHYPLMTQYIIPEFPLFLILPLFMMAALLAVMVYRRKSSGLKV